MHYLHSEVQTLERVEILRDLRLGEYDVVVGINLLREGLDLPEVSLVAILDADKEGFLRSDTALIQTIGRAARHVNGKVIMYADKITDSMRRAIDETNRRRQDQMDYNREHGIEPVSIVKAVRDLTERLRAGAAEEPEAEEEKRLGLSTAEAERVVARPGQGDARRRPEPGVREGRRAARPVVRAARADRSREGGRREKGNVPEKRPLTWTIDHGPWSIVHSDRLLSTHGCRWIVDDGL